MVFITAEDYKNAEVHTISVKNKYYFWVKMNDIQDGLDIKICQIELGKTCVVFLKLENLLKNKKRKGKKSY